VTTVREIQAAVCQRFGLTRQQLCGPRRHKSLAWPRMLAMYLCRDLTGDSYPDIGRAFLRDHSTAIAACRKIERLNGTDWRTRDALDELYTRLGVPRDPLPAGGGC